MPTRHECVDLTFNHAALPPAPSCSAAIRGWEWLGWSASATAPACQRASTAGGSSACLSPKCTSSRQARGRRGGGGGGADSAEAEPGAGCRRPAVAVCSLGCACIHLHVCKTCSLLLAPFRRTHAHGVRTAVPPAGVAAPALPRAHHDRAAALRRWQEARRRQDAFVGPDGVALPPGAGRADSGHGGRHGVGAPLAGLGSTPHWLDPAPGAPCPACTSLHAPLTD